MMVSGDAPANLRGRKADHSHPRPAVAARAVGASWMTLLVFGGMSATSADDDRKRHD